MPINPIDAIVIGVTLISAVLAMVRGATREVLAISSWGIAALAAWMFYKPVIPYVQNALPKTHDMIATVAAASIVFLVTLLVVSFISVKISDLVLDSRIGAVDRALGFIFGVLRGFFLCIIGWAIISWFIQGQDKDFTNGSRTYPYLESSSNTLKDMIPDDLIKKAKDFNLFGMMDKTSEGGNDAPQDSENAR